IIAAASKRPVARAGAAIVTASRPRKRSFTPGGRVVRPLVAAQAQHLIAHTGRRSGSMLPTTEQASQ
ncbi:MAG TPA: hypothetical protein VFV58_15985, partial [Blastocatellia bacterium]|nr:hypothetical protein [Blastocatellia bacterium]